MEIRTDYYARNRVYREAVKVLCEPEQLAECLVYEPGSSVEVIGSKVFITEPEVNGVRRVHVVTQ